MRLSRRIIKFINDDGLFIDDEDEILCDIVGEIIDDIDDLDEDEEVTNGNRFLEMSKLSDNIVFDEYENYLITLSQESTDSSLIHGLIEEALGKLKLLKQSNIGSISLQ